MDELHIARQLEDSAHQEAPAFLLVHVIEHSALHFLLVFSLFECLQSLRLQRLLVVESLAAHLLGHKQALVLRHPPFGPLPGYSAGVSYIAVRVVLWRALYFDRDLLLRRSLPLALECVSIALVSSDTLASIYLTLAVFNAGWLYMAGTPIIDLADASFEVEGW